MGQKCCRNTEDDDSRRKQQGSQIQFKELGDSRNQTCDDSEQSRQVGYRENKHKKEGNADEAVNQGRGSHGQSNSQASKDKSREKDKKTKEKGKSKNSQTISEPEKPLGDRPRRNQTCDDSEQSRQVGYRENKYKKEGNADEAVNQGRGSHGQSNSQASKDKSREKDKKTKEKGKSKNSQTISEPEKPLGDRPRRGTEDKVPLVLNGNKQSKVVSDTGMKNRSHGPTSESASGGIYPGGNSNLRYQKESHALQRAEPSTSFPDKGMKTSEAEVKKLKEKLTRNNEDLYGVRQELETVKRELNEERKKFEEDLQRNIKQIKQLDEEKHELLNRLSSQAAARMTYDNPNITDLSDQNRPTKISEQFSELYDNLWTDAFENLQNKHQQSETEAISFLLDVLRKYRLFSETITTFPSESCCERYTCLVSFDVCRGARKRREDLLKALKGYIGEDGDNEDVTILEVMRTLKGTKKNIKKMEKEFKQDVEKELAKKTIYKDKLQDIKSYMDECVKLCLLMNIQEPPLELKRLELSNDAKFDLSTFKPYTESGNMIKYIVWPAMYLYQNGPLLCKGVAQGMPDPSNVHKPTSAKHNPDEKQFTTEVKGQKTYPKGESMNDEVPNDKNVKIEREMHKDKLKVSPTSTGSLRESRPHQSQKETEKSRTQYDKPGSSAARYLSRIVITTQSTETTSNDSTRTGQQEKVEKPQRMTSTTENKAEKTHL